MKIDNIEYRITRKARCRRVTLTVAHSGEVLVTAPGRIREKNIRKFLESEQTIRWVRDSLAQHEKMRQRFLPNGLSEGASFPYLGQNRRVEVIENGPAVVDLAGEKFLVRLPWGLGDREKERRIAWMLTGWYKARAAELLAERVSAIGARTGETPGAIRIKTMKSRWGSCSTRKNINFNWKLLMAPPEVVDYVVAHELCHLEHQNHSAHFWKLLESVIPDYYQHRRWLHERGSELMWIAASLAENDGGPKRARGRAPKQEAIQLELF